MWPLFPVNRRSHLEPDRDWPAARCVLSGGYGETGPCAPARRGPSGGFEGLIGLDSLSLHNIDEDKESVEHSSTPKLSPMQCIRCLHCCAYTITHAIKPAQMISPGAGLVTCAGETLLDFALTTNQ